MKKFTSMDEAKSNSDLKILKSRKGVYLLPYGDHDLGDYAVNSDFVPDASFTVSDLKRINASSLKKLTPRDLEVLHRTLSVEYDEVEELKDHVRDVLNHHDAYDKGDDWKKRGQRSDVVKWIKELDNHSKLCYKQASLVKKRYEESK